MSNQNPLKKTNINKYKYPVSSCTCAIMRCMCPFEWVNNHAEKPYVQSVGCPTFRDDDVRRNIIGFFVVVVVSGFFFFWGGGMLLSHDAKKQADHMVNKYCGKNQTKLSRPLYFLFGRVKANAGFPWLCAPSHRHKFISFSINDVRISRASPGPAGPCRPAQLPWVQTHHSVSVRPSLPFCLENCGTVPDTERD